MSKRAYKFRIEPTKAQETLFVKTLELCRWVYNKTLETRKDAWEKEKKSIGYYESKKFLPAWKETKPELESVHSQVLQNISERVELAFRTFFQRIKKGEKPGYPRFKGFGRYDSFTFPQYGNGVTLEGNLLSLSKVGTVKVILHREIPAEAKIKRITIKREANQWFVTLSVEETRQGKCGKGMVGIDLGCKTFITLSDGSKVDNPKFGKNAEKKIAKAQRKLERQPKGTFERAKARKVLAKVYQKVNHQRDDFLHKTSRKLVSKYEILVFEDLDIQEMLQSKPWHNLNRTIMDAAWGRFVFYCSYKAEDAGGIVGKVNPKNTSKMCSQCGALQDMPLDVRVYVCRTCGSVKDRDWNSSINILRLGQKSFALQKSV